MRLLRPSPAPPRRPSGESASAGGETTPADQGAPSTAKPPRLVLCFALYTAFALALAGAGLLVFAHTHATDQAESAVRFHARFVADTILRDHLRPSDFEAPVTGARRRHLDRLFRHQVLVGGTVRVKLWSASGLVTYSSDHSLIGTRAANEEVRAALAGNTVSEVSRLNHEGGRGQDLQVLQAYAPVRLRSQAPAGVFELYQDYRPVAAAARKAFLPVALALGLALLALYATLLPILRRVTARLQAHVREIEHQARHDRLTGLPNRLLFRERLERALDEARCGDSGLAVLLLDLDHFKEINDTLGHEKGDLLLRELGRRLRSALPDEYTLARLGGDELAVLAPGAGTPKDARSVGTRLAQALHEPIPLGEIAVETEASIGIALFPDHGRDADTLLRRADVAMYASKELYSGIEVYASAKDRYSPARLALLGELRQALAGCELVLYYQPQRELASGRVRAVEALARWRHGQRGLLSADAFIPLAERTGLIRPLTRYVLDAALRQCRAWAEQGLDIGVAVNITGRDLADLRLPEEVAELLRRWRVEPTRLELEITETGILSDVERTHAVLAGLSDLGVRLAIDDFGAGYSSLGYLKRLPVQALKIDKSFVLTMAEDEDDAAIVRSTIGLGHNLGLTVVAEGVESEEAWQLLAELGCDAAQGFYLSPPLPAEALDLGLDTGARAATGLR